MRDIFSNKITTKHHWEMLMVPTAYTKAELDFDVVVGIRLLHPIMTQTAYMMYQQGVSRSLLYQGKVLLIFLIALQKV